MGNFILQSEKIRWGQSIKSFETQEKTLCGDMLLTAAFVSYVGSFTRQYRRELVDCKWVPFLQQVRPILHAVNMGKTLQINYISGLCVCQLLLYLCRDVFNILFVYLILMVICAWRWKCIDCMVWEYILQDNWKQNQIVKVLSSMKCFVFLLILIFIKDFSRFISN